MVNICLQNVYQAAAKISDAEAKELPKTVKKAGQQVEEQVWKYLSSRGVVNSALVTKPSLSGTGALKKYEQPVAKIVENAEKNLANKAVKRATLTSTKDLTPIQSQEEYLEVLERIKKAKNKNGEPLFLFEEDLKNYADADAIEQGLIPYCGHCSISAKINQYLSGRIEPTAEMQDVARALDYSLSQLDKKVGKYDGIVFRQGFMDANPKQYLSTSKDPTCAARFDDGWADPYDVKYRTYSVIKTKGGHDIASFQKKMNDILANREQEVLLSHKAQYREVPVEECTEELLKAREEMASRLFKDAYKLFNGSKSQVKGYTKEDLLNLVKVYVEV